MTADERTVDASIAALRWWRGLKATSNEAFLPLFFDQHRFLVLCGGGGSGKSIFAGRKILERCATEPGHRWLVCRKVGRTLRHSCWSGELSCSGHAGIQSPSIRQDVSVMRHIVCSHSWYLARSVSRLARRQNKPVKKPAS